MRNFLLAMLAGMLITGVSHASIITGQLTKVGEGAHTFGDATHQVTMFWSVASPGNTGYFYGRNFSGDSDVAGAPDITDIGQVVDAGARTYWADTIGPFADAGAAADHIGDFVFYQNINTGLYGVIRIDDFAGASLGSYNLTATWWIQTDGTGNFSAPEPASMLLLGGPLLLVLVEARRRALRQAKG